MNLPDAIKKADELLGYFRTREHFPHFMVMFAIDLEMLTALVDSAKARTASAEQAKPIKTPEMTTGEAVHVLVNSIASGCIHYRKDVEAIRVLINVAGQHSKSEEDYSVVYRLDKNCGCCRNPLENTNRVCMNPECPFGRKKDNWMEFIDPEAAKACIDAENRRRRAIPC